MPEFLRSLIVGFARVPDLSVLQFVGIPAHNRGFARGELRGFENGWHNRIGGMMLENLKGQLQKIGTTYERLLAFATQSLIVVSMVGFSIGTMPDLTDSSRRWLDFLEVTCVAIFTFEYFARVWLADNRLKFIFSFFGIVDLLAILPFYLSLGLDLRSARAFRLLRLFRLLKLARYSAAIGRFRRALALAKEELILFGVATTILLFLAAVGIYQCEHHKQPEVFSSVFDSLWWAVVTLTTVGYGDAYPITTGGKIFTTLVLMIGLGVVAVPTGIVSSALQQAREELTKEEAKSK